jgi:parallel beta-helix repeat protein
MRLHNYLEYSTLALLFLMMLTSPVMLDDLTSFIVANEGPVLSQLTSVSPISITSDAGFVSHPLGFPGNGSESDPYRIENYDIEGTLGGVGILIGGSVTVYYEIRNCRVYNTFTGTGINLQAGHGVIDSCEIFNTRLAINAFQVDDVSVANSNFHDNEEIIFEEASDLNIIGNSFSDVEVTVLTSTDFTVNGNTFDIEANNRKLHLIESQLGAIRDNIFNINALSGIQIENSQNVIISGCEFLASGPEGTLGVYFPAYGEVRDITIQDCTFEIVHCGGVYVNDYVISNCIFLNSSISLVDSPSAEVSSNSFTHGQIYVGENCYNSVIFNNTLLDCVVHGIRVRENNTGVIVSTNYVTGIVSYKHGLYIESDDVTIRYNTIQGCDYGIYLPDANGCTIHNNTVFGNNRGIHIDSDSSSNTLYYNILYDNSQMNANDDGTNNIWDDGVSLGNYWGNLDRSGEYVIPGVAAAVVFLRRR